MDAKYIFVFSKSSLAPIFEKATFTLSQAPDLSALPHESSKAAHIDQGLSVPYPLQRDWNSFKAGRNELLWPSILS